MSKESDRRRLAADIKKAEAEYRAKHWGEDGDDPDEVGAVADTSRGVIVRIGSLPEIVYYTSKGGEGGAFYRHKFDKKHWPVLGYVPGPGRNLLVIAGGAYDIKNEGIVG